MRAGDGRVGARGCRLIATGAGQRGDSVQSPWRIMAKSDNGQLRRALRRAIGRCAGKYIISRIAPRRRHPARPRQQRDMRKKKGRA